MCRSLNSTRLILGGVAATLWLSLAVSSCRGAVKTELLPLHDGMATIYLPATGIEGAPGEVPVDVYTPPDLKKYAGDILVLPGWKFSRTRWHKETPLLKEAGKRGFRLVFPDMMISCYESQYFPQTQAWIRWGPMPGGQWVKEILIPHMQKRGIFLPDGKNFLLGLSTGGRGVALVHLHNPGLFTAGAALSGDFDQTVMPGDKLMTALYGPYKQFPDRWKQVDNPAFMISRWTMPIYLGHGHRDTVVPFSQTQKFYELLKASHPQLKIVFNDPSAAGHDFRYWSSEISPLLDFFLSL